MELFQLIQKHQKNKHQLQIQDVYKLLYQSVFGVAHILKHQRKAKKLLEEELQSIEASTDEALIENISTNAEIVRINLRPFKALSLSTDLLFSVMLKSAKLTNATRENFDEIWGEFKNLVRSGRLCFDQSELKKFDTLIIEKKCPPVHHSGAYRAANRPAYRVVQLDIFKEYFAD